MPRSTLHRAGLAVLTLLLAAPAPALAQYFGRNKVQYEDFDFRVLETEHFDIHYYPAKEAAARDAARMAERWYDRLSQVFVHQFDERKPLIFYADKPDFQQTNTTAGFIGEATGGFTEGLKNRVVMPFTELYGDTDHVLGHELVHAFQYDISRGQLGKGPTSINVLPLWAVEGMAEYFSVGRTDAHTAMWLRDAVLRDDLPSTTDLARDPRYFPYRFGHAFWAYVAGRWGDEVVTTLYRQAGPRGLGGSIRKNLGVDPDSLSAQWVRATREHFEPLLEGRTAPGDVGERVVRTDDEDAWVLAPTISPDGTRVAFLSQLDIFSVDLFLADARTGEVLGKLASAERDAHFDALAYINAAGAWSPDGEQFAFVTVARGDNEIAIADADRRRVVRRLPLEGIGAVSSLAWSPDGGTLVVSGQAGGLTDLWRADLASGAIERLTEDAYAELHPDVSPDGRTVAFATDRGAGTDLEGLRFAPPGIGFLDLASGEIEVRRPFPGAKHINPRWSPDGESLYFVSDREGFSDVYRLEVATDEPFQVTRVATGVSGITPMGPALSVARRTGTLVFSVFDEGNYVGVALDAARARGEPVEAGEAPALAAVLPPTRQAPRIIVSRYLEDAAAPPPAGPFATRDYRPGLQLDFIAPPTAGVAVDRFGTQLGGSIAFFWSDMLSDHQLGSAFQAGGDLKDLGGEVIYRDIGSRLNWGVLAGRIPLRTGFVTIEPAVIGNQPVEVISFVREWMFLNSVALLADYPFNLTRRIETEIGYTRVGFDREAIQTIVSGGIVLDERKIDLESPEPLDLANASVAFVHDQSFFGFTSPVRGGRARFAVEGNFGTLDFATVLADWRRYAFARPVTFALRGLFFGRFLDDAESDRLSPLFIGYPSLVRGYESGSFDGGECTLIPEDPFACPEFDRLIGSRIAVAKAELRIPLVGTEQFGLVEGGFLPTELALFTDAGVAWTSDESPEFAFERESIERIPVFGSGASLRLNLAGTIVAEFYYVYPFQRPREGGHFGFQLAPGW